MARDRKHYRRGRRSKKGRSLGKTIGIILGGTVAFVAAAGVGILASKLSKIDRVKLNPEELNVSVEAKETKKGRERGTGYLNVALFGLDSRDDGLGEGNRSDTIMVASLNRETLEVKISSVYRDTLLEQKDGTLDKANAAYSYGGPEDAIALLNRNLDLDIEHYVAVNFNALIDVIDAVGGIEIDVQQEELSYICGYATEIMKVTGKVSPGVTEPGPQVLNGVQATAYARIRGTLGDDFRRTERQRDVLAKIVEKLQNASMVQLNAVIDKVFPEVSTNFTLAEILDYAQDAFEYKLGENIGFPFDKTTDTLSKIGSVVIPVTLEDNVKQLHEFLFGSSEGYTVSSTVSDISDKIVSKAGDRDADTDESSQGYMEQPDEYYNPSGGSSYTDDEDDGYNYGSGTGSGNGSGGNGTGSGSGSGSGSGNGTGNGTGNGNDGTGSGDGTDSDPGFDPGGGEDPGYTEEPSGGDSSQGGYGDGSGGDGSGA